MAALLEVKNLGISFGGLRAVDGFDISRSKEEQLYGLIGPNGAGKTTVFNLLTGVYKPDTRQDHAGRQGYHRKEARLRSTRKESRVRSRTSVFSRICLCWTM